MEETSIGRLIVDISPGPPPLTPNSQAAYINTLAPLGGVLPLKPGAGTTTAPGWATFYGDGSDGALNVTSGTTTLTGGGEYWYTSVNVSAGATLTNGTANLPLVIRSQGPVTIAGTIAPAFVNVGVPTSYGGGTGGGGGGGTAAGTGGGGMTIATRGIGPGGLAGTASGGTGGNGQTLGTQYLKTLLGSLATPLTNTALSLGGSMGGAGGSSGGAGGGGGGCVIIVAPSINFTGLIDVSAQPGVAVAANSTGGGGGGGGGLIVLAARSFLSLAGTLKVNGGAGGGIGAFTGAGAGGAGGAGNSYIYTVQ